MSFDQPPSERQSAPLRREDDPEYRDDPEFTRFAEALSVKLFSLTSNISRLSQQVNHLGTKRDTERVRERVHDLLEEARNGFREVGDGIKRLNAWEDLNVSVSLVKFLWALHLTLLRRLLRNTHSKRSSASSKLLATNSKQSNASHSKSRESQQMQSGQQSVAAAMPPAKPPTAMSPGNSSKNNNRNNYAWLHRMKWISRSH